MLKVSNKNRKKEKVLFSDPFRSSEFKKEEKIPADPEEVVISHIVTEEDLEAYKKLEMGEVDDISITIFWISVIVVSVIGLLL